MTRKRKAAQAEPAPDTTPDPLPDPPDPTPERPRQQYLPGEDMAPPSIPIVDEAARDYVEFRDARMSALKQEIEAHDKLLSLMQDKGLTEYNFEEFSVRVDSKTKVKVRRKQDAEEE